MAESGDSGDDGGMGGGFGGQFGGAGSGPGMGSDAALGGGTSTGGSPAGPLDRDRASQSKSAQVSSDTSPVSMPNPQEFDDFNRQMQAWSPLTSYPRVNTMVARAIDFGLQISPIPGTSIAQIGSRALTGKTIGGNITGGGPSVGSPLGPSYGSRGGGSAPSGGGGGGAAPDSGGGETRGGASGTAPPAPTAPAPTAGGTTPPAAAAQPADRLAAVIAAYLRKVTGQPAPAGAPDVASQS